MSLIRLNKFRIKDMLKVSEEVATEIFIVFMALGIDIYKKCECKEEFFIHDASLSISEYNEKTKDQFSKKTKNELVGMAISFYESEVKRNQKSIDLIKKEYYKEV